MPLQLLKYNPGIVKDITEYSAGKQGPFWVDGDLVRFKNGYPEKIGGWQKEAINGLDASGNITTAPTQLTGIARKMVFWRAISDGEDYLAVGTHNHLYIVLNGSLYDITPLRKTSSSLSNPIATTDGSTTVVITDASHGARDGDFVCITGASATGGIAADDLNRYAGYQITVINTNTYQFTAPSAATSTVSAGGGTVSIKYLIGNEAGLGSQSADPALGWGVGGWGGFGLGGTSGTTNQGAIQIGSEVITYTGVSTNTLTGCTRGANSYNITTTLASELGSGVTTATLSSTDDFTTGGTIVIGSETITYTGVSGQNLTGLTRTIATVHTAGTLVTRTSTAQAHSNGATVSLFGDSTVQTTLNEALDATETEIDLTSATSFSGSNSMGWNDPALVDVADVALDNSSWSLNLWGEDLLATIRGGAIYRWDTSGGIGNRAVLVSSISGAESVPTVARVTTISFPDRHFIAGGTQAYAVGGGGDVDNMLVRWSTQEDFTKFGPTSLNTAGDQRLEVGTKIVAMANAREETIISTDEAIYGMTFVGEPFIFAFRLLATDAGAAGLNTMMSVDGNVFWMGKRNFFIYDGIVKELPCSVQYFVFDRMQTRYIDKVVVGHNKKFKEITWFYVSTANSAGETNPENDSYVTYNYLENAWSIGTMDRSVWSDSFGVRSVPFAFDPSGILYNHETGTNANGAAMDCFIESSPRELTVEGNNLYMVDKLVPDVTMTSDTSLSLFMNTRKYPAAPETTKGPFTVTQSTEKVSTRAKGRQIALKWQSTGTLDQWTLGDSRINTREDGLR
jgi:hypothetical protein